MLSGKKALVTGASRGIGRAIAAKLMELGAQLAVAQRGDAPEIGEKACVRVDLADVEAAARAVDEAAEALGHLDILVCNAGAIDRRPALEVELADWERVVAVNLTSVFAQAQAAAKRFLAQGNGGQMVFIASLWAFHGGLNVSSYAASKGGLVQLTKSLANEWAPLGIRVNAVAPGWTETEFTEPVRADEARRREITARIPAGRWARPEEIAEAAAFLVSPGAGYVHGHVLTVDGGYLSR